MMETQRASIRHLITSGNVFHKYEFQSGVTYALYPDNFELTLYNCFLITTTSRYANVN